MSTTLDTKSYIGRKIDLLAFRNAIPGKMSLISQSLADETTPGEICAGIQKLAQRFLLTFLTDLGSIRYRPDSGTDFMRSLRQGRIRTEADMRAVFALAELQARAQLQSEESTSDPADERYKKTTLTAMTITSGTIKLHVKTESRAESANFILPLPIAV